MANTSPAMLDGSHAVLTPEYVEFNFVLAGLYSRFLAWFLDAIIVMFATMVMLFVLSIVMVAFPGFGGALFFIVYFLVDWGYGIAFETAWSGQTIGKKAFGLRVLQESGVRIGFYHAALRNLARPFVAGPDVEIDVAKRLVRAFGAGCPGLADATADDGVLG